MDCDQAGGALSCSCVACFQCWWGFLAATVSAVPTNCRACTMQPFFQKRHVDRGPLTCYFRALFDPSVPPSEATSSLVSGRKVPASPTGSPFAIDGEEDDKTVLQICGGYSQSCGACWQERCCVDAEGDNGYQVVCFTIFTLGAAAALPVSLVLGCPGLFVSAVKACNTPSYQAISGDHDFHEDT